MRRWWDDADAAALVLAAVDDSDVEQGVGTAALGLHALAKAALAPLLGATLVDRVDVAAVLEHLPLEPVSKALAEATRPLLSEAADRYGVLLATELSHQARDGASAMVQALTARGLPMPLAVARAAEVAGLPPNRIGPYVEAMKDPATTALVVADAADRALMTYAAALGRAEAAGTVVAKSEQFEEMHPRDGEGRFALRGGEMDPRTARMERRKRRAGRTAAALESIEVPTPAQAKGGSLGELVRALRPKAKEVAERVGLRESPTLPQVAAAAREPARKRAAPKKAAERATSEPEGATTTGWLAKPTGARSTGRIDYQDASDRFIPIPLAWVTGSGGLLDGGISASRLAEHLGGPVESYKATELEALYGQAGKLSVHGGKEQVAPVTQLDPSQWVMLRQPSDAPIIDTEGSGDRTAESWTVALEAQFRAVNHEGWKTNWHAFEDARARKLPHDKFEDTYGVDVRPMYRVIDLELTNKAVLDKLRSKDVNKAAELEHWQHGDRMVARDEHGEFSAGGGGTALEQRQARRARRARRHAAAVAAEQLRPVAVEGQTSLTELVARLRPAQPAAQQKVALRQAAPAPLRALAEQAKEVKRGRTAGKAKAKTVTEPVALAGFGHQEAMLLTEGELQQMFGLGDLDFLGRGHDVDTVADPEEKGYGPKIGAPKPVLEQIDDLNDLHAEREHKVGPRHAGLDAARRWMAGHRSELANALARAQAHPEEHTAPRDHASLVWRQAADGSIQAVAVEEPEQRYLVYGDPAAIAAAYRRDPTIMLHLRQVAGVKDTHELAEHEGARVADVGAKARPLIAIHLEASGGERLIDLPPQGKTPSD